MGVIDIPEAIIDKAREFAIVDDYYKITELFPDYSKDLIEMFSSKYGLPAYALARQSEGWYKCKEEHKFWPHYRGLIESKGDNWKSALKTIDKSTTKIANFMFDPEIMNDPSNPEKTAKYGLVVGYVQSGKTANFTGLIAKSIDSGYNLILVLAGTTSNLRNQTQKRLEREISLDQELNIDSNKGLYWLTSRDRRGDNPETIISGDFGGQLEKDEHGSLQLPDAPSQSPERVFVGVLKKKDVRLSALEYWVNSINKETRGKINLLMIDDESDSASADVSTSSEASNTNSKIRTILSKFERRSYVGYTATPYASVLTSPISDKGLGPTLYPRDFIVSLPKSSDYHGVESFFSNDGALSAQVRVIPESDSTWVSNPTVPEGWIADNETMAELPDSLKRAIFCHFLTFAAKSLRREMGLQNNVSNTKKSLPAKHHTMVVHNNMDTIPQEYIWKVIQNYIRKVKNDIESIRGLIEIGISFDEVIEYGIEPGNPLELMKHVWESDFLENPKTNESWEDILPSVFSSLESFNVNRGVLLINSKEDDKETNVIPANRQLDYDDFPDGANVIAVGGNILSRGLTLEGLTVSYFVRETQLYDSLTQMGRWFGYRPGYEDLVRVFTSSNINHWFNWLVDVESDLRNDIKRYDELDKGPLDLAVRVLKHVRNAPGEDELSPTRQTIMKDVETYGGGFDGMTPKTNSFHLDHVGKLARNIEICGDFCRRLSEIKKPDIIGIGATGSIIWKDVHYLELTPFISDMDYPLSPSWKKNEMIEYIGNRAISGESEYWNVCLINNSKGNQFSLINTDLSIGMNVRNRMVGKNRIDELTTSSHLGIDLEGYPGEYAGLDGRARSKIDRSESKKPLLLIYVIDKDSSPDKDRDYKRPTESLFEGESHRENIIGLCASFPYSDTLSDEETRLYMHAKGIDPVEM